MVQMHQPQRSQSMRKAFRFFASKMKAGYERSRTPFVSNRHRVAKLVETHDRVVASRRRPPQLRLQKRCRKVFTDYPILSNSVTYGTLYVSAEVCQQIMRAFFLQNNNGATKASADDTANTSSRWRWFQLNFDSVKRYALWGTFVVPPVCYKWYKWLDSRYHVSTAGRPGANLAKKLALDQFVFTPVILALFFVVMSYLEGRDDLSEELRKKFTLTFLADCCFWLPLQALNFRYVSPEMRIVFIAMTTFVWLNILCLIKSMPVGAAGSGCGSRGSEKP